MMEHNQILPIQVNYLFITFCFMSDERAGKAGGNRSALRRLRQREAGGKVSRADREKSSC